tara:strand:+ start:1087 stop:1614 length:528 start_codon:yes stop_codon:yes gene_type:complete
MGKCHYCDLIEKPGKNVLVDEDKMIAILAQKGVSPSHIELFTKQHFTIMEQIPDALLGDLFVKANLLSTTAFESLGMQGTNIIVMNGVAAGQKHAHVVINIIPRAENDGLNYDWAPKQLTEEEMSTIELKIKEQTEKPVEKSEDVAPVSKDTKPKKVKKDDDKENYLLKSIERIP